MAGLLYITASVWLAALGSWLALAPNIRPADAIAVYGGNFERTLVAARLYREDWAPQVWHTGWDPSAPLPNSTKIRDARQELLATVPQEARTLVATESTWEDAAQIARLTQERNIQSILVITDWFHSRRALCSLQAHLGEEADITVFYMPVPVQPGGRTPTTWWHEDEGREIIIDEYLKIGYYALYYGVWPWGC